MVSCLIKISEPKICYDFELTLVGHLKSVGTFCAYINEEFLETTLNIHSENGISDIRFEFHDKPFGIIDSVIKSTSSPLSVPTAVFDDLRSHVKEHMAGLARERFIETMNDIANIDP